MIELLQLASLAVLTCVAASAFASGGLKRLCPAVLDEIRHVRFASIVGAVGGAVAVSRHSLEGGEIPASDLALIPLCGFLASAAYVDYATAWAPDELTFPICLLSGVFAFEGGTDLHSGILGALGLGFVLFAAAKVTWILQACFFRTIVPPPDVVAISLPFVLFDAWETVVLHMAMSALVLTAMRCFPRLARFSGNRECLETALGDTGHSIRARGVAFLGIAYPLVALLLTLNVFFGWDGTVVI